MQVARQFEVDKHVAEAEVRALRRKLADATNEEDDDDDIGLPLSKRSRVSNAGQDEVDEESVAINAGRRFVILFAPWLRRGEETFKIKYNTELLVDEDERFENVDNKIQGEIREIKIVLGDSLAREMATQPWIAKAVSHFL